MMGCVSLKVVRGIGGDKGRLNSPLVKAFCGSKAVLLGGMSYCVTELFDILFCPANVSQG